MAEDIEDILRDAAAARRAGATGDALTGYERAAGLARSSADAAALGHALRHVCDLAREEGDTARALEAGAEAVVLMREHREARLDLANALRVHALAAEAIHGRGAAAPLWREARSLYCQEGVAAGVEECDRRLIPE